MGSDMRSVFFVVSVMFVASSCVTTSTEVVPVAGPTIDEGGVRAQLERTISALPTCKANADVGALVLTPTFCTEKHCTTACCNACGWNAKLETAQGTRKLEASTVQQALSLKDGALECEVRAWNDALAGRNLGLTPACLVR